MKVNNGKVVEDIDPNTLNVWERYGFKKGDLKKEPVKTTKKA